MSNYRKYWTAVLVAAFILAFPLLLSFRLVSKTYETTNFSDAVKIQLEKGALYGPGLINASYEYKLSLASELRPELLAVGSSRAMQFRKEGFKVSFANAGGSVSRFSHVEEFIHDLFKVHKPKMILLAIDYWWFNDPIDRSLPRNPGSLITAEKLTKPLIRLYEGIIDPELFFFPERRLGEVNAMGLRALAGFGGYRPDGSLSQGNYIGRNYYSNSKDGLGLAYHNDLNASSKFDGFRTKNGSPIKQEHINKIIEISKFLHDENVQLVVFLPPVANSIAELMRRSAADYEYIESVRKVLVGIPHAIFADFHDPSSIGSDNCEFYDGYHGGDLTYLRILQKLAGDFPVLRKVINLSVIEEKIEKYKGRAFVPYTAEEKAIQEVDFLGIGCKK